MSNHNPKLSSPPITYRIPHTNRGFTLIEMLIIAPIVILVIGVFVSAIITMTGDVLSVRGKNALVYNIQDALNRIDQDVKSSGGYLATNNITLTSPQGYDDDRAVFKNAVGLDRTMLILNTYATTANPLSSTRNFVYTTGPNACNSALVSQNQKVAINIVYFVKNNALWRRVIAPLNYATIGCSVPWQQPSCETSHVSGFCKTPDIKLVDGVSESGFVLNYYTNAAATTPIANAVNSGLSETDRQTALQTASTVDVKISATRTLAGRDVSQSGTIRSINPNNDVSPNKFVSVLVVGGGGGGGADNSSGGGGGGGLRYNAIYPVTVGPVSVTVGGGGSGGVGSANGATGSDSSFGTLTVSGGGGGAQGGGAHNGVIGGSGGGAAPAGGTGSIGGVGNKGLYTPVEGYRGGDSSGVAPYPAGGGGGAGEAGVNGSGSQGGRGGNGLQYFGFYYAGGGGASLSSQGSAAGVGGNGGGGAGGGSGGSSATTNTGGGGGAGTSNGGNGGSGIVIISYPTNSILANGGTVTLSGGNTIHTFTSSSNFIVGKGQRTSCVAILNAGESTGDGIYWIYPTGSTGMQVYCDMTTSGGGWVLAMQIATGFDSTFNYRSNYWNTANTLNDVAPPSLSSTNAKYNTFNTFISSDGYIMLKDKTTNNFSTLSVPSMVGTTLLNRFQTLGGVGSDDYNPGVNLTLIAGKNSPQELMGYTAPTTMCAQNTAKWRFNRRATHSGSRIGNDVATNDQTTDNPSSWSCYDNQSNLSTSGVGDTLEYIGNPSPYVMYNDGYGSESLDRWRTNYGVTYYGQGSHKGVSIFVR